MPKYIEHINAVLKKEVGEHDGLVVFGQNVSAGSRISGFTKGFKVKPSGKIVNTTNTENSLVGFGFGMMLAGGTSAYFVKQLDFLYLGIDQMVDTYNILRNYGHAKGSFTVLPLVVDMGYQGPQSSADNFGDFCSIARIPGYTVTNKHDAELIVAKHLVSPGFRIIAFSQRMFKDEVIDPGVPVRADEDLKFAQYKDGTDATIVSFNFSFPYAWKLGLELEQAGKRPSVFNVNYMTPIDWKPILESVKRTKKLVVLDDSKSENLSCFSLLAEARALGLKKDIFIRRTLNDNWLNPVSDAMDIDYGAIVRELGA
jgi:acetoin:2,6-dichlorophenolindophenol oxidoreductase subunit beta